MWVQIKCNVCIVSFIDDLWFSYSTKLAISLCISFESLIKTHHVL